MIISPNQLLARIHAGKIVKGLSPGELHRPEGVGFDLRLASLHKVSGGSGSISSNSRRTPRTQFTIPDNERAFQLQPGACYLATTMEEFDLPKSMACQFFPRSTLFRSGIGFHASILPPGYVGPVTFMLSNLSSAAFHIEQEARFAHAVFLSVRGTVNGYNGSWNGGRISQPLDEEQA